MTEMETLQLIAAAVVLASLGGIVVFRLLFRRIVVWEHERGLRYVNGRFRGLLGPGVYWILPGRTTLSRIDIRPRFITVPGQELLTSEGVSVKISVVAKYEIADPARAVNEVMDFSTALYTELQLAARDVVAGVDMQALLADRNELSRRLEAAAKPRIGALGLTLLEASIKDIMLAGRLRDVFAQVVTARQEGLAALERARAETAALRSLANAARMVDDNPNLMQLRMLQVLGETSGNTVVVGIDKQVVPVKAPAGAAGPARASGPGSRSSKPRTEG